MVPHDVSQALTTIRELAAEVRAIREQEYPAEKKYQDPIRVKLLREITELTETLAAYLTHQVNPDTGQPTDVLDVLAELADVGYYNAQDKEEGQQDEEFLRDTIIIQQEMVRRVNAVLPDLFLTVEDSLALTIAKMTCRVTHRGLKQRDRQAAIALERAALVPLLSDIQARSQTFSQAHHQKGDTIMTFYQYPLRTSMAARLQLDEEAAQGGREEARIAYPHQVMGDDLLAHARAMADERIEQGGDDLTDDPDHFRARYVAAYAQGYMSWILDKMEEEREEREGWQMSQVQQSLAPFLPSPLASYEEERKKHISQDSCPKERDALGLVLCQHERTVIYLCLMLTELMDVVRRWLELDALCSYDQQDMGLQLQLADVKEQAFRLLARDIPDLSAQEDSLWLAGWHSKQGQEQDGETGNGERGLR